MHDLVAGVEAAKTVEGAERQPQSQLQEVKRCGKVVSTIRPWSFMVRTLDSRKALSCCCSTLACSVLARGLIMIGLGSITKGI